MKANTPGEELGTVALVEKLKQFVESNDDKVPPIPFRSQYVFYPHCMQCQEYLCTLM